MSWKPQDIVSDAMSVYINACVVGSAEDVIWSRPATEFAPTSRSTKGEHDGAMTGKVERLRTDHALLRPMVAILGSLPDKQYHAILAKYILVGLNIETSSDKWKDGRAWTDQERCKKVAQGYDEYRKNVERAKKAVYAKLREIM